MEAVPLKGLREANGWTQVEAAKRLRVSQSYWSLLEAGARELTPRLAQRCSRALGLSPAYLPLPSTLADESLDADALARQLGALGYSPFAYLKLKTGDLLRNPVELFVRALLVANLDPRLAEGLPWLLLRHRLDEDWLVTQAKLHDLQNRVGFLVSLARELAERHDSFTDRPFDLAELEAKLERSRLAGEDTLCEDSMTEVMRQALRQSRSPAAAHWNLVTDWKLEHLQHDRW